MKALLLVVSGTMSRQFDLFSGAAMSRWFDLADGATMSKRFDSATGAAISRRFDLAAGAATSRHSQISIKQSSPCGFWRLEHPQSSINTARRWNTCN